MKVTVIDNNRKVDKAGYSGNRIEDAVPLSWYVVGDSALSNTGKPFFIPEGAGDIEVTLSMAIRFNRLGKTIAPKFARRYFKEVAPALHFRLKDKMEYLKSQGMPVSPAVSFDRCIMADSYKEVEDSFDMLRISLSINGKPELEISPEDFILPVDNVINEISMTNTVKMGDILLPSLSKGIKISIGDFLEVARNGVSVFTVKVK